MGRFFWRARAAAFFFPTPFWTIKSLPEVRVPAESGVAIAGIVQAGDVGEGWWFEKAMPTSTWAEKSKDTTGWTESSKL